MVWEKERIKLICVCAVSCAGKSTYVNAISGKGCEYDTEEFTGGREPIVLSLGIIFREALGDGFFADRQRPHAPDITNNVVKSMVFEFTKMAYESERDIIVDGFPRTDLQVQWLLLSSFASMRAIDIEVRFLYPDECELVNRRRQRLNLCDGENSRKALEQRFVSDRAMFIQVFNEVLKSVKSGKFDGKLTMKEIDI